MSIVNDLISLLGGTISGLPTIVVLVIPLVVGLIIGFLIKKVLKIGIILAIVALIAVYFGFISLGTITQALSNLSNKYGPTAMQYVAMFFGIIPLGIGLVLGIILGFIFG
jgi:uncharacterized membrane protein (Fun14 family)